MDSSYNFVMQPSDGHVNLIDVIKQFNQIQFENVNIKKCASDINWWKTVKKY